MLSPDQTNLSRSLAQTRAKAIIARNDANSGYTTYSKLTDTYLNGATDVSTREAKTQSDRLDRQRNDSVKTVHYYRNGHNLGTVSTLTAAENAGFLHGMEFDVAQAAGRCTPHQDWMTEDTVVFAFAIFRHGLRVMLQLTMRIKGGIEKAQEAMSILRQHLFGVRCRKLKRHWSSVVYFYEKCRVGASDVTFFIIYLFTVRYVRYGTCIHNS